jgi:hypothetical protein
MDDHFILEIENNISEDICKQIIRRFENDPFKEQSKIGTTIDGEGSIDLRRRNSKEICISPKKEWNDIDKILKDALGEGIKLYRKEIEKKIKVVGEDPHFLLGDCLMQGVSDHGYIVQRVEKDSWFRWHHDSSYNHQILTVIWYLNTMDISNGGRTEFISGRKVLPKVGKLLIFPSTWTNIHCGSLVRNQYKYICTTGIYVNNSKTR